MPIHKRPQIVLIVRRGPSRRGGERAGTESGPFDGRTDDALEPAFDIWMADSRHSADGAFRSADDTLFWSELGIHLLPLVDLRDTR